MGWKINIPDCHLKLKPYLLNTNVSIVEYINSKCRYLYMLSRINIYLSLNVLIIVWPNTFLLCISFLVKYFLFYSIVQCWYVYGALIIMLIYNITFTVCRSNISTKYLCWTERYRWDRYNSVLDDKYELRPWQTQGLSPQMLHRKASYVGNKATL